MLIDWFTVAAQVVNFLILVYLLKRFLYQPIVRHMNEREEKIKHRLQQASDKRIEAEEKIEEFERKIDELEQLNQEKLEQARKEAQKRKKELLEEAKKEVEKKRETWLESLNKEKETFAHELKQRSGQKILQIAQRALHDLADESLTNRLAEVLLDRIEELDQEARDKLARAGEKNGITVRSTFELDASRKKRITTVLHDLCGKEAEVVYQADEKWPLGIEIRADSVKLSWGTEKYLDELNTRVMTLIEEKSHKEKNNAGSKDKTIKTDAATEAT